MFDSLDLYQGYLFWQLEFQAGIKMLGLELEIVKSAFSPTLLAYDHLFNLIHNFKQDGDVESLKEGLEAELLNLDLLADSYRRLIKTIFILLEESPESLSLIFNGDADHAKKR